MAFFNFWGQFSLKCLYLKVMTYFFWKTRRDKRLKLGMDDLWYKLLKAVAAIMCICHSFLSYLVLSPNLSSFWPILTHLWLNRGLKLRLLDDMDNQNLEWIVPTYLSIITNHQNIHFWFCLSVMRIFFSAPGQKSLISLGDGHMKFSLFSIFLSHIMKQSFYFLLGILCLR